MNNPDLFRKSNMVSRMIRTRVIKEFQPIMKWRPDGKDSLLDIGCAGGDLTTDEIQWIMPKTYSRLVGVDINEKMVQYANKTFGNSRISFSQMDVGGDITEFLNKNELFDHVTSLNCLHLVPDQKLAIENIYKLLTPKGNCLLYTISDSPNFTCYYKMVNEWHEYMEDADDFVSYFYNRINPKFMFKKLLKNAGFSDCIVEERESTLSYDSREDFENAARSIVPFYTRIPEEKRDRFNKQFMENVMEHVYLEDGRLHIKCKHLIAYATK